MIMLATVLALAQEGRLRIAEPAPHQVIQRSGFEPARAHEHEPGGPKLGHAVVAVRGDWDGERDVVFEWKIATDWTSFAPSRDGKAWTGSIRLPAGGGRRLQVRVRKEGKILGEAAVEPFGVGEVFIVAGQSYAAGANDVLQRVQDAAGRVSCLDIEAGVWRVAHDPQPGAGDGGTIWPALGDLLVPVLRVPVGFVNVAVGGTASRQWVAGTPLYARLAAAQKVAGGYRAVLWQQGESDVIEKTATEVYVERLGAIRASLGGERPWLLAKSTLHPTVYNDPAGEGRIREALERLGRMPGFRPGPDTDILGGENRGGMGTRRHFSGIGQQRAALLWFAALWAEIHRAP